MDLDHPASSILLRENSVAILTETMMEAFDKEHEAARCGAKKKPLYYAPHILALLHVL